MSRPVTDGDWLVHVDRQALPVLRRMVGAAARVSAEVGEGFRVWSGDALGASLAAAGLVRFAMPVACTLTAPLDPRRTAALVAGRAVRHAWIFPIRRHGRFAAAHWREWARGAGLSEAAAGGDAPRLMIACGDAQVHVGVATPLEALSPWPGGLAPAAPAGDDELSRAAAKLEESLAWLGTMGVATPQRWLELGAFPGGMTAALARLGADVLAVDLNPPSPRMLALPGVRFATADAAGFTPAPESRFDAILCDMNGPPANASGAVARLARYLARGALVVHTIKLPSWDAYPSIRDRTTAAFAAAGIRCLGLRHHLSNRQEVTFLGRVSSP